MSVEQPPIDGTPPRKDESGDQPEEGPFDWLRQQIEGDPHDPDGYLRRERRPIVREIYIRNLYRDLNQRHRLN